MEPSELRHLCDIHMEILKDELEKLKSNISRGHVLDTLVEEHAKILGLLEDLEIVTNEIVKMDKYNKENVEFSKALEIVQGILDAELHHKREAISQYEIKKFCFIGGSISTSYGAIEIYIWKIKK